MNLNIDYKFPYPFIPLSEIADPAQENLESIVYKVMDVYKEASEAEIQIYFYKERPSLVKNTEFKDKFLVYYHRKNPFISKSADAADNIRPRMLSHQSGRGCCEG